MTTRTSGCIQRTHADVPHYLDAEELSVGLFLEERGLLGL